MSSGSLEEWPQGTMWGDEQQGREKVHREAKECFALLQRRFRVFPAQEKQISLSTVQNREDGIMEARLELLGWCWTQEPWKYM